MHRYLNENVKLLKSKVSHRIFLLFIICALIPIAGLATISLTQVTKQMSEQGRERLARESKSVGMHIYEHLHYIGSELQMVSSNLKHDSNKVDLIAAMQKNEHIKEGFTALLHTSASGVATAILGTEFALPEISGAELTHMALGKSLIQVAHAPGKESRVLISRLVNHEEPGRGILTGEIRNSYLWEVTSPGMLSPAIEALILDDSNRVLTSTLSEGSFAAQMEKIKRAGNLRGTFEWYHKKEKYISSYWSIFLKYEFFRPGWKVVLNEPESHMLAPIIGFKRTFPFIVILSLLFVALMSVNLIKRSLVPLTKLREGTRRIANKDFSTLVDVKSGDEFEELAHSLNSMAGKLNMQFKALATIAEIDRAILTSLNTEKIINTVINRMWEILPSDSVSVALIDPVSDHTATLYLRGTEHGTNSGAGNETNKNKRETPLTLKIEEIKWLKSIHESLDISPGDKLPDCLAPLAERGLKSFLLMPILVNERLSGVITVAWFKSHRLHSEETGQLRQLADQVTIALSNSRLVSELKELNWGTLTALARTVDAKSPWTAGHSERVTNMAVEIGRELGLAQNEIVDLHRAALLHDIGKISISPAILDKPMKLTAKEYAKMCAHPETGRRILEPIKAYAKLLPMVAGHHESYDGTGYPDGLAGDDICVGARILAVADVFDAIISDRPYRPAMEIGKVVDIIKNGAGTKFDPRVVTAFLTVLHKQGRRLKKAS